MKWCSGYYWLTTALMLALAIAAMAQEDSTATAITRNAEVKKKRLRQDGEKARPAIAIYSATSKPKMVNLGRSKNDYIIVDWAHPAADNIASDEGLLEIKLKIFSSHAIRKENIAVYNNQQRSGSKMDVAGLFGDQKEFNYSNRVLLTEGINEIIVEVVTETMTRRSEPMIVHKKGKNVSISPMGVSAPVANPLTSVYWWTTYDPVMLNGKPYSSKEKILPIRFKILTRETLLMENIRIHHNELVVRPRPTASLERDYQGNYTFTDEIDLLDAGGLNEIYLEVVTESFTATCEKLMVDYSPLRPNLHILSIGTETNLQYTLKDARDFAALFTRQGGAAGNRIFNKILIDTLFGSRASAHEIKGRIEELKVRYYTGSISPDDVILTFVSSHGFLLDGDFRIQGDDYSPARQRSTSVSFKNEVVNILDHIPCKKIIMIDACHSGGARANPSDINFEINKLNSIGKGLTVLASSRGEEQSYEDPLWQNGAFTASIVKGLRSAKADADRNGIISMHELFGYVSKEVAAMVRAVKNRSQNPLLVNDELGDVAIYVVPGQVQLPIDR